MHPNSVETPRGYEGELIVIVDMVGIIGSAGAIDGVVSVRASVATKVCILALYCKMPDPWVARETGEGESRPESSWQFSCSLYSIHNFMRGVSIEQFTIFPWMAPWITI